jgi:hypothetical protein
LILGIVTGKGPEACPAPPLRFLGFLQEVDSRRTPIPIIELLVAAINFEGNQILMTLPRDSWAL